MNKQTLTLKGVSTSTDTVVGHTEATENALGNSETVSRGTIEAFTEEQLREQLAKLTGKKPLGPRPEGFQGIWDETSMLPVQSGPKAVSDPNAPTVPAQLPPALHGNHALTARQIDVAQNINPATGLPYAQVTTAPRGGMISPPPTRNFR